MRNAARFLVPLVLVLACLAWAASTLVDRTGERWFERDVELRAQLAVTGAHESLVLFWRRGDAQSVGHVLAEITRDERIMFADACGTDGKEIARTPDFPDRFSCAHLATDGSDTPWFGRAVLDGGAVHLSVIPVFDHDHALGRVTLVQDMTYADQREATGRWFTFVAFSILALAASIATVLAARFSWRTWTAELRRRLRGRADTPEMRPLLRDVRELVAELAEEAESGAGHRGWDPERLRYTLRRDLQGERLVVVANREPHIHERAADGTVRVLHPASGLVTALEPVMRACSGVWVAHGSGSADRSMSDRRGRVRVPGPSPDGAGAYDLRRIWLSEAEERGYYYGFANEGLWPLCHIAHTRPIFRSADFAHYETVNQRFADAVAEEAGSDDPVVLVQDYHFALLPRMLRDRLPRATILTFWHIPWPNAERFGICPFYRELLEGLLGSNIIGFHTQLHCNNFIAAVDRYLEARIDREQEGVVLRGQVSLVRPYPISIATPSRWMESAPSVPECRAAVRSALGLPPDTLLGIGVDRLDYTKGIEERLLTVERLLERCPRVRGRFTFLQVAAPSRASIQEYKALGERVTALAERINRRFSQGGYRPVILLREHHEPPDIFRFYRAADVCYVSSLHDGMNLVAKEFVGARDDEQGVLVLSRFTGAARELTEALIVNPYDLEEASAALETALFMSRAAQADRMRLMRALLREHNIYRWAGRMLADAAKVRQRHRLSGRLETDRFRLVRDAAS